MSSSFFTLHAACDSVIHYFLRRATRYRQHNTNYQIFCFDIEPLYSRIIHQIVMVNNIIGLSSSRAGNPLTVKCDFCDLVLKSDLDVSKHLISPNHHKNVENLVNQNQQHEKLQRETPKSLGQVFKSLKLRHVKDIKDLAEKKYFRIPDNNQDIFGVTDQLINVLLRCVSEYEAKDLPSSIKESLLEIFQESEVKGEPEEPVIQYEPPPPDTLSQPQAGPSHHRQTQQDQPTKRVQPQQEQSNRKQAVQEQLNRTQAQKSDRPRPEPQRGPNTPNQVRGQRTIRNSVQQDQSNPNRPQQEPSNRKQNLQSQQPHSSNAQPQAESTKKKHDDVPKPRLDSNYKPVLAKIKVEPKDN